MTTELFENLPYEIWLDLCEETGIPVDELRDLFLAPSSWVMPYTPPVSGQERCDLLDVVDRCGPVPEHSNLWYFELWYPDYPVLNAENVALLDFLFQQGSGYEDEPEGFASEFFGISREPRT